ncbi:hypothetical protein ACJX0J_006108, partial [Zea mays]
QTPEVVGRYIYRRTTNKNFPTQNTPFLIVEIYNKQHLATGSGSCKIAYVAQAETNNKFGKKIFS